MRFPGKRKRKHYFPVGEKKRKSFDFDITRVSSAYVVGIDQVLVDIEANIDEEILHKYGLAKGESVVLSEKNSMALYEELKAQNLIKGEFAGGAIGNTLHNYSILSDARSILLGVINENIKVGDYAFKYICHTHNQVNLTYLTPVQGAIGLAFCLITPDAERSFGISMGKANELPAEEISDDAVKKSTALVISAYLLRDENLPIYSATLRAVEIARENNVPVCLSLGTSMLIKEKQAFFIEFIQKYVDILAMNKSEAYALVGIDDPLLAAEKLLDIADFALLTDGPHGMYVCCYCDEEHLRETDNELHSKSISEYNRYEFSRAMLKHNCLKPTKIYSHINPYLGGPGNIKNTNGAGDGALAALLHDITSNTYHKERVPNSSKHNNQFLTYSSIGQICKYANRVSFEVLRQNSPRLQCGLPEKEESLEESYWDQ